jgi:hypothetical protein
LIAQTLEALDRDEAIDLVEHGPHCGDDSEDHALAESVVDLFKAEVIPRLDACKLFKAVAHKTLEWVTWFNHQSLLQPVGNIPGAKAEPTSYAALENIKIASWGLSNLPSGKSTTVQNSAPVYRHWIPPPTGTMT